MAIKFEVSWVKDPITIKCENNYTEKYVKQILRKRLEEVFGHKNFVVWICRDRKDGNRKYTYEITKMFDYGEGPLLPVRKGALNV